MIRHPSIRPPRPLHGVSAAVSAIALVLVLAVPTAGQSPGSSADGLWWAITVGGGGTRLTCDLCQPSRDLGPTVAASVGAYGSEGLRVGVEAGGWTHEERDDLRETAYRAGVVAQLTPNVGSGLYLLGGFGWTGYRSGDFHFDAPRVTVGAGWELPLAPGWVIGNELALDAAAYGSLRNEDIPIDRPIALSTVRMSIQVRRR